MQESNSIIEFSLFPVPTDMLKALKLDPSDTVHLPGAADHRGGGSGAGIRPIPPVSL